MEVVSFHVSGAQNFEMPPRDLENLCTSGLEDYFLRQRHSAISFITIVYELIFLIFTPQSKHVRNN
jgi:hypothetical protein